MIALYLNCSKCGHRTITGVPHNYKMPSGDGVPLCETCGQRGVTIQLGGKQPHWAEDMEAAEALAKNDELGLIKRFDYVSDECGDTLIGRAIDGDYVLYADHMAEVDELRKELKRLQYFFRPELTVRPHNGCEEWSVHIKENGDMRIDGAHFESDPPSTFGSYQEAVCLAFINQLVQAIKRNIEVTP